MMMMTGDRTRCLPTVQIPPWPTFEETTAMRTCSLPASGGGGEFSPYALRELNLSEFLRFLPSSESDSDELDLADPPVDAYSCDEFRIYEFKVRRCPRGRSHDWTECPFAHPGEKARRRDPRKFNYSGASCPEFRKGNCKKGDACEFAHGVFESWLHPARYRTQPCKDGTSCRRRVCFFAHTPEQLRVLPADLQPSPKSAVSPKVPESYDGSPLHLWAYLSKGMKSSSPTSTLAPFSVSPPSDSPPFSPVGVRGGAVHSEMLDSMKRLQLSDGSWGMGFVGCGFGSPRGLGSVPVTPTSALTASRGGFLLPEIDREIRGCFFDGGESPEAADVGGCFPDVGWVSDLVK